jgi:creatinine amidohydrolase
VQGRTACAAAVRTHSPYRNTDVVIRRPDLAHPELSADESDADLRCLLLPAGVLTTISWYASFPDHYQGDSSGATPRRGEAATEFVANAIVTALRAIQADDTAPRLQAELSSSSSKAPLKTKQ